MLIACNKPRFLCSLPPQQPLFICIYNTNSHTFRVFHSIYTYIQPPQELKCPIHLYLDRTSYENTSTNAETAKYFH